MAANANYDIEDLYDHVHGNPAKRIVGLYPRTDDHEARIKAIERATLDRAELERVAKAKLEGRKQVTDVFWNGIKFIFTPTVVLSVIVALWGFILRQAG